MNIHFIRILLLKHLIIKNVIVYTTAKNSLEKQREKILPPWQQNIFSSTMAATGKQLKQSVNVFQSLILYLLLPEITILTYLIYNIGMM